MHANAACTEDRASLRIVSRADHPDGMIACEIRAAGVKSEEPSPRLTGAWHATRRDDVSRVNLAYG
ncbi:MAG: hypothetical protein DMG30_07365 [Acidobacteria bacterium]|nr:MAG: hypothetical protein DMG30_07365 [Acidobacteriota bacterium]